MSVDSEDLLDKLDQFRKFLSRNWSGTLDPQQMEECVQSTAILWMEGKSLTTGYKHIIIDWCRANVGIMYGKGKSDALHITEELDDRIHGAEEKSHSISKDLKRNLSHFEKLLICLRYERDFETQEIAKMLDLSPGRVSQFITEAQEKIKNEDAPPAPPIRQRRSEMDHEDVYQNVVKYDKLYPPRRVPLSGIPVQGRANPRKNKATQP